MPVRLHSNRCSGISIVVAKNIAMGTANKCDKYPLRYGMPTQGLPLSNVVARYQSIKNTVSSKRLNIYPYPNPHW